MRASACVCVFVIIGCSCRILFQKFSRPQLVPLSLLNAAHRSITRPSLAHPRTHASTHPRTATHRISCIRMQRRTHAQPLTETFSSGPSQPPLKLMQPASHIQKLIQPSQSLIQPSQPHTETRAYV
jgi:hypothetical protein